MSNFISRTISLIAVASLPVGLVTIVVSGRPVAAANLFDICVNKLSKTQLPMEEIGSACADALDPEELSLCVQKIERHTPVPPKDALLACYRVRRPEDLADCVADIHNENKKEKQIDTNTLISDAFLALDYCRRSLLPERYSECVMALSRNSVEISPPQAMETCISAEDFPRDLFPEYVPE